MLCVWCQACSCVPPSQGKWFAMSWVITDSHEVAELENRVQGEERVRHLQMHFKIFQIFQDHFKTILTLGLTRKIIFPSCHSFPVKANKARCIGLWCKLWSSASARWRLFLRLGQSPTKSPSREMWTSDKSWAHACSHAFACSWHGFRVFRGQVMQICQWFPWKACSNQLPGA